jgi:hypothetical protein
MGELWVPPDASTDDLVTRIQQQARAFAERQGFTHVRLEVQLRDDTTLVLDSLAAEPGYGFLTLRPHVDDEREREELVVPVASVAAFRFASAENEPTFGFALPEAPT